MTTDLLPLPLRTPTAARPLLGVTVLVVEDSRFACEALRLLCLHSGARIRRADSLATARRHLRVYRPTVVIVDMGLPDGSGTDLIAELARAPQRVEVLLGLSGDPDAEGPARDAGADAFLAKPLDGIAAFQTAILSRLPAELQPPGPRPLSAGTVDPDPLSYREDLLKVAGHLAPAAGEDTLDYVTQFLAGIALSARDPGLGEAVDALARCRAEGRPTRPEIAHLSEVIETRIGATGGF